MSKTKPTLLFVSRTTPLWNWRRAGPRILTDDTPIGPEWVGRESNNCILFGTKGTLRLKPLTLFEDEEGKLTTVPLESHYRESSFEMQLQQFCRCHPRSGTGDKQCRAGI